MPVSYTYCLFHIPTGMRYYGVRISKKVSIPEQDLWVKYFSSSEKVKKLIQEHGKDSFQVEIRQKFDNPKKAIEWEKRVLFKLGVPYNKKWLNKNIHGKPVTYWLGKRRSKETIDKFSSKKRGMKDSLETRQNKSLSMKRRYLNTEYKEKIRLSNIRAWTDEKRQKLSDKMTGSANPNYGKKLSDIKKSEMSKTRIGKKLGLDNPNKSKYNYLLHKEGMFIYDGFSLTEMGKFVGINPRTLRFSCYLNKKIKGYDVFKIPLGEKNDN